MGKNKIETVLFKTAANSSIGYGHLYRCLSLATALKQCGVSSVFLANTEAKSKIGEYGLDFVCSETFDYNDLEIIKTIRPEVMIFDSYLADLSYIEELAREHFFVHFDDNNDVYPEVIGDILINGNIHAKDLHYIRKKNGT
ncbi:MAG: hypothetical protein JW697_03285, partial [Kosmotogaceae bacterium]|nr:hypothetical protein [Kosmotogaceae bacterium]